MKLIPLKGFFLCILLASFLTSCHIVDSTSQATVIGNGADATVPIPSITPEYPGSSLADFAFPASIDPASYYMFYLHGRIIEDQGLPAVSKDFGEYQYEAILEKLESQGFIVISEQRSRGTDPAGYAMRVAEQIKSLRDAGVPSENITVVGASQGAGIAAIVSSLLKDSKINFVLLGFCSPDTVKELIQDQLSLYGNILAIRDSVDNLSGSCQELFKFSEGKGLARHNEIVLDIGTGHGILYKPLEEWIQPAVEWAKNCGCNQ